MYSGQLWTSHSLGGNVILRFHSQYCMWLISTEKFNSNKVLCILKTRPTHIPWKWDLNETVPPTTFVNELFCKWIITINLKFLKAFLLSFFGFKRYIKDIKICSCNIAMTNRCYWILFLLCAYIHGDKIWLPNGPRAEQRSRGN